MSTELVPTPDPTPPVHTNPVQAILDGFLSGRSPATVRAYSSDLTHFARWWLPGPIAAIRALDQLLDRPPGHANLVALSYRNAMLESGLSAATVNRRLAALKSFVKLARTLGRVTWGIEIDGVKPEPRRDMRGPDEKELRKVVRAGKSAGDAPRARRDRAILALLAGLALRRGEVVGLDLADVDFRGGTLKVLGKGRRERVSVPMSPEVSRALSDWVVVRGNHDGPLFHRTDRPDDRGRLVGESVRRLVARLAGAGKVGKTVRPHGLRHAAITNLLSGGESVRDVMGFSRHRKIETVMRYDDRLRERSGRLAEKAAKVLK